MEANVKHKHIHPVSTDAAVTGLARSVLSCINDVANGMGMKQTLDAIQFTYFSANP
jgi:hypothetical protein